MPARARIIEAADALIADLQQRNWSLQFTPTREYAPLVQLEDTDQLMVTVVATGMRKEPDNRYEWRHLYDLDIGIQYRTSPSQGDGKTQYDLCLKLLEEIGDLYNRERPQLADMTLAGVEFGGPSGLPYVPDHILQFHQFTGIVRLTFSEWR